MRVGKAWDGIKLAFEFLVLTATRSAEVRLATWQEIDLVSMVWTIPQERMKAKREHRIPLSKRALEVLRAAERLARRRSRMNWCSRASAGGRSTPRFSRRRSPGSGSTRSPHGFRSSFRDWASERTDHPREVVEAALAHTVRDQTEAAYARSDLFERRRHLMDDWAEYLKASRGEVVTLRR